MQRIKVRNAEEAKAIIKAAIQSTEETRLQHRLHCILLVCHGKTCADVAVLFDDALRTVQHWVKRFNDSGIDGLRDAGRPGRQTRLSKEEREILAQDLRLSPREFGYMQNLWDGKLLSYHLEKKFHVKLKVRQCQNLFHTLGFRRRKPRPIIAKADTDAQEAYKKTEKTGNKR